MDSVLLLLVTLSGVFFAVIGFSSRIGAPRGVDSLHVAVVGMLGGMFFFGGDALAILQSGPVPERVWLLGLAAGLTQYAGVRLIKTALRMGPLTPLWTAQMLAFVPVILYASLFLNEKLRLVQIIAVGLSGLTIYCASRSQDFSGQGPKVQANRLLYLLVLSASLLLNSVANIAVKDLAFAVSASGRPLLDQYGGLFYFMMYLLIWLGSAMELLLTRRKPGSFGWMLGLGTTAGLGSLLGVICLRKGMALPAAVSFTLSSTTSILCAALAGALFFGEKRTRWWWATVASGTAVILVANGADLLRLISFNNP
jgi:drug/metabolite transporter (DMT)-like permease